MKVLLLVLVLALAGGGAYYYYFKDHPLSWTQGPELASKTAGGPGASAPAGKKDFKDLCARLQGTMDRVPVNLREARQMPADALDIRAKLAPHLGLHAEYVTITQVCDLIVNADQAFAEHQEKCGFAPAGAGVSPQERTRIANNTNPVIFQARQTLWNNQRLQADSKVRQLLATLENRRL